MTMKKQGFAAFLRRKQYVIAGAIVAVAAVGTTMYYSSEQEKERQQMEAELAQELAETEQQVAVEEETEQAQAASSVIPPTAPAEESADTAQLTENGALTPDGEAEVAANEQMTADTNAEEEKKEDDAAQTAAAKDTLHFSPDPVHTSTILHTSALSLPFLPRTACYKTHRTSVNGSLLSPESDLTHTILQSSHSSKNGQTVLSSRFRLPALQVP